jgi:hypothetical protein
MRWRLLSSFICVVLFMVGLAATAQAADPCVARQYQQRNPDGQIVVVTQWCDGTYTWVPASSPRNNPAPPVAVQSAAPEWYCDSQRLMTGSHTDRSVYADRGQRIDIQVTEAIGGNFRFHVQFPYGAWSEEVTPIGYYSTYVDVDFGGLYTIRVQAPWRSMGRTVTVCSRVYWP